MLEETVPCDFEMSPEVRLMFERDQMFRQAVLFVVRHELDRVLSQAISRTPEGVPTRDTLHRLLDAVRP